MGEVPRVEAAGGLALNLDPALPHWRVEWGEPDWFGPVGFLLYHGGRAFRSAFAPPRGGEALAAPALEWFAGADDLGEFTGFDLQWRGLPVPLRTSVWAYADQPFLVFRIEADDLVAGLGSDRFEEPGVAWPTFSPIARERGGVPDGTRAYGHAYFEFAAAATASNADCADFTRGGHRPSAVQPLLLIAPDGRTLMLAPLDGFHEQLVAVPDNADRAADGLRCGWHGDLAEAPEGFATELALWAGASPRAVLEDWGALLQQRNHTQRPTRYADDGVGKLSYWTDNGAFYYYRTEPGCDYPTTLERELAHLRERDVPVRSVQLDSWFYPHVHLRPVGPEGAPEVPPSGMVLWEPREDLFPDGFATLQEWCGGLPLTFHSRHFCADSPYFAHYAHWTDGAYAHPRDPAFYDLLMANAASWGAITYEQDWLVEAFLKVRGLREAPGRARAWQEALDRAAGEHGLTLQWCMATPADFMQTVTLRHVTSIRTSGDYRYLFDNGLNWYSFLQDNALARALGLWPYKDVFLTHPDTPQGYGEPYAEAEALLAALSAGPVGIGDKLGYTDRDVVMRACREDGVLVKPDVPIAALSRCFPANAFFEPAPLIGETYSLHPAGRWVYVASLNAYMGKERLRFRVALADLGAVAPAGPVVAYDWRTGDVALLDPADGWDLALEFQDWDLRVLCPLLPGNLTVFGDVTKYATAGDQRVAQITATDFGLRFDVLGAPHAWVDVTGYAAKRPAAVAAGFPHAPAALPFAPAAAPGHAAWRWDPPRRVWSARVRLGATGRSRVELHAR